MDFDQLLIRYFGTNDLAGLEPAYLADGVDRIRLRFGLEHDAGRRFGIWCLLYTLDAAPDLDAFEDARDRDAARDFMNAVDRHDQGETDSA
jgi:hypothetical protein